MKKSTTNRTNKAFENWRRLSVLTITKRTFTELYQSETEDLKAEYKIDDFTIKLVKKNYYKILESMDCEQKTLNNKINQDLKGVPENEKLTLFNSWLNENPICFSDDWIRGKSRYFFTGRNYTELKNKYGYIVKHILWVIKFTAKERKSSNKPKN